MRSLLTRFHSIAALTIVCSAAPFFSNAQSGCTDPAATNYDSHAVTNDGSCVYPLTTAYPVKKGDFDAAIPESSGLIYTGGKLWTHNDSGNPPQIFSVDTATGATLQTVYIDNFSNTDWEDITADSNYVYVSDCGNNDGSRKDLKILKISKADIGSGATVHVNALAINVSYADQTSFAASSTNNFDCESVLSINDSLYLFSKDRGDGNSRVYKVCKTPGTYVLTPYTSLAAGGLVTGADYDPIKKEVVLVGYLKGHLKSFLWIMNDFKGDMFFSGNKRRIEIGDGTEWQTEGVCYRSTGNLLISCESAGVHNASLFATGENWGRTPAVQPLVLNRNIAIMPNPASNYITITGCIAAKIKIYNVIGQLAAEANNTNAVSLEQLSPGMYYVHLYDLNNTLLYQQQIIKK